MISKIKGKIVEKKDIVVIVEVDGGMCYEVFIPQIVMKSIDKTFKEGDEIILVIFHYYHQEPSRLLPVLIGFLNDVEKEFFEKFISVSGIGPKAALKAFNMPLSVIARAIDDADLNLLKSLPGIGQQRARDIIAKLQGKVGKFGLIQDEELAAISEAHAGLSDIKREATEVLLQLQYKSHEAKEMVEQALKNNPRIESTEELLNEVYRQRATKVAR